MNLIPFGLQQSGQGQPGSSISQYDKLDKKYNFTEFLRENPRIDEKDEDHATTQTNKDSQIENEVPA